MTDKALDRLHGAMFYGIMLASTLAAIGWLTWSFGWQAGALAGLGAWTLAVAAAALFWGTAYKMGRHDGIDETKEVIRKAYER